MICSHTHDRRGPLCWECGKALTVDESHFFGVCLEASAQGLPLTTKAPAKVSPEREREIAALFGFSVPGQKATQAEMFAQSTMEAL